VLLITSGSILQENIKAVHELENLNLPYKLINVINLSTVAKENLRREATGAGLIVTSIDAQPSSLARIVYESGIVTKACPLMALGVTDLGSYDSTEQIYEKHGISSGKLVKTARDFFRNQKNPKIEGF